MFKKYCVLGLVLGFIGAHAERLAAAEPGCLVEQVHPGSPADSAGLRVGDVIISVSSAPVRSEQDLRTAVAASAAEAPIQVRRGQETQTLTAHLEPDAKHGYRLGVLCSDDHSVSRGGRQDGVMPRSDVYLGPMFSSLAIGGDFDGEHVLVSSLGDEVSAVPSFNRTLGYGGVIGLRSRLPRLPIDAAMEFSYQQGKMDNFLVGAANDKKAVLHEVGITGKGYFYPDKVLQPVIGLGLDFPWLTVPEGTLNRFTGISDSTFSGIGLHGGGGVCFYVLPQLSIEALVMYHWRHFDRLNGDDITPTLISRSVEPSVALRYHFLGLKPNEPTNKPPAASDVPGVL